MVSLGVLVAADRHSAIIFRVGGQLWSTAWDSQGGASWVSETLAGYQGFPKAGLHDDGPDGIWDLHLGQWKHGVVVGYWIRFFGRRVFVGACLQVVFHC